MTHARFTRIIAIELRHRRLGFAVIETPNSLLDFGVRTFGTAANSGRILGSLIQAFLPCAVVAKRADHRIHEHRRDVTATLRVLRQECARRAIRFEAVDLHEVRCVFRIRGCRLKEEVAQAVADAFPELAWKLPPTRRKRSWVNEGWNMAVFDAAAAGLAFLDRAETDAASGHA